MVVGLLSFIALAVISAVVYVVFILWARRSGRSEPRYWLTLLGSIICATLAVLILRWASPNTLEPSQSKIIYGVFIGLSILGAIAGSFIWRKKPVVKEN